MLKALTYLATRSAWNRFASQMRRLRTPRYVIALLLGLFYLFVIVQQQRAARGDDPHAAGWVELAAALGALGAAAWAWLLGSERRALAFSPADVTFLFAGPVTRRTLVGYKLFRSQLAVLVSVLLWTLLLSRERFGVSVWLRAVSLWLLLTTLSLHRLGASFVRSSIKEHGARALRRRLLAPVAACITLGIIGWTVWRASPALAEAARGGGPDAIVAVLTAIALQPPLAWVLVPFHLIVRPLTAPSPGAWLHAIWPALGILAAHVVWVISSDAAFEESAAEYSLSRIRRETPEERARGTLTRSRRRRLPGLLRLEPTGWPAGAIVWKNLVAVVRLRPIRAIAITGLAAGLGTAALSFGRGTPAAETLGSLALVWAGVMFLVGPQWVRNDFRDDLSSFALLRSFPLRGESLVAAEVAGSALVLTLIQLGLLTFAYLAFLGNGDMPLTLGDRTLALIAAVVYLPPINYAGMLIQNGASILFPAWVRSDRIGGVEALGQNMLLIAVHAGALVFLVAGPALAGTGLQYLLRPFLGGWAEIARAAVAICMLILETRWIVRWLGGVLERTEPAAAGVG
jgi:hypothetical protein